MSEFMKLSDKDLEKLHQVERILQIITELKKLSREELVDVVSATGMFSEELDNDNYILFYTDVAQDARE